jgi:hypothetical protein
MGGSYETDFYRNEFLACGVSITGTNDGLL